MYNYILFFISLYHKKGVTVIRERFNAAPYIPPYRGNIYCPAGANTSNLEKCEFAEVGVLNKCIEGINYGVICQGKLYSESERNLSKMVTV